MNYFRGEDAIFVWGIIYRYDLCFCPSQIVSSGCLWSSLIPSGIASDVISSIVNRDLDARPLEQRLADDTGSPANGGEMHATFCAMVSLCTARRVNSAELPDEISTRG